MSVLKADLACSEDSSPEDSNYQGCFFYQPFKQDCSADEIRAACLIAAIQRSVFCVFVIVNRQLGPMGQAKARNGLCWPSRMNSPIGSAWAVWISIGKLAVN